MDLNIGLDSSVVMPPTTNAGVSGSNPPQAIKAFS